MSTFGISLPELSRRVISAKNYSDDHDLVNMVELSSHSNADIEYEIDRTFLDFEQSESENTFVSHYVNVQALPTVAFAV